MVAARQRLCHMAVLMTESTLTWRFVVAGALAVFLTAPPLARTTQGQDAPPTIRQLTDDVNSTEAKVRRKALKSLAAMGPEALTPLSLLVADSDSRHPQRRHHGRGRHLRPAAAQEPRRQRRGGVWMGAVSREPVGRAAGARAESRARPQ